MILKRISSKKMGLIISMLFFAVLLIGVLMYKRVSSKVEYVPTAYEMELIEYFKEVILESEYYDSPHRITKWKKPMVLFISKDKKYERQINTVRKTINGINELSTDGFKIQLTDDISKCNTVLYLCERQRVQKLAPNFYDLFAGDEIDVDVAGFSYVEFDWSNYIISKALIFVETIGTISLQESTVLEEITQSIGISNDSKKYPNSIFYDNQIEDNTINKEYSKMDIDIIKLLYHPEMKPGLNGKQCEKVIMKILKEKSSQSIN